MRMAKVMGQGYGGCSRRRREESRRGTLRACATSMVLFLAVFLLPAAEPPLTLEVFSDFQCPYCKAFAPTVATAESLGLPHLETRVRFRYFPLSFHPDAQIAAQAAAAAERQGKFWEMHDFLFAHQSALKRDDLLKYAAELKLDMERFRKDLDSDAVKKQIADDLAEGTKRGVQGTPTFFLNGASFTGTRTLPELIDLAAKESHREAALKEVTDASMAKGPADAPVTIEFFADLESPVSRTASYALDELMGSYPGKIRLQFRNFPLSYHPQAALAHNAAMAAARQGHFWELQNYIFDHQESIREQDLIVAATRFGLDAQAFEEVLRENRYAARVDADVADGNRRGLHGSPVIFVNGKRIDGVPSPKELREYVEAALK